MLALPRRPARPRLAAARPSTLGTSDGEAHMRRALSIVVLLWAGCAAPAPAADAPPLRGLYLTTDYPAIAARAGETTTIKLKLQNYNLAPERVVLGLDGVPQGWKAALLGG